MKYIASGLLALVLFLGLSNIAIAAEFVGPSQDSGNVTIPLDSQHKNLYVAGGNVLVNGKTLGDLYVAGGNVTVEGDVEADLVVAGGSLYINGMVGGDVRSAGGDIIINSKVAGDVIIFGGTVSLTEKASVGGDLVVNSGEAEISSPVEGKLIANGGIVNINSAIKGSVSIMADQQFKVGPKAVFTGDAKYKAPVEAQISEGAQTGNLQYEKISGKGKNHAGRAFAGIMTIGFVIKILAMVIAGLLLIQLFPKKSTELVHGVESKFWPNMGLGFLGFVLMVLVPFLLIFTLVGFYVAILGFLLLSLWSLVAVLLSMTFVGSWVNKKLMKKSELIVDWQAILIGVVLVSVVMIIPVLGFLLFVLIFFASFGTILRHIGTIIKNQKDRGTIA